MPFKIGSGDGGGSGSGLEDILNQIKARTDRLPDAPASETTLATLSGQVDSVKTRTDLLPDSPASEVTLSAVGAQVAGVKSRTDHLPDLPASEITVSAVGAQVSGVKTQTDKLSGNPPLKGSVTANWQAGMGTSGLAGSDLVSIGAPGSRKKLHSLTVGIGALTPGATVAIRLLKPVNDVWTQVYRENFVVGTDPDGCWVVNGTLEISGLLRCECSSDRASDDGRAVSYEYDIEDMS